MSLKNVLKNCMIGAVGVAVSMGGAVPGLASTSDYSESETLDELDQQEMLRIGAAEAAIVAKAAVKAKTAIGDAI
ncbi:MAG: hypothetical protein M3Q07_25860, partial [Pseudobdellovibrionaceae bacterium]|nr:hypothetical protein [Pseudobdellovibrionaceae bacterium]